MKYLFTLLFTISIYSVIAQQEPWQELTGDMPPARAFHTMVEINGTVYLFGGEGNASRNLLNDLWEYNENTGRWDEEEPSNPPPERRYHAAVAINGQVYVFGGQTQNGNVISDVLVYSPDNNEWTKIQEQSPQNPKVNHRATAGDNKIWITGGYDVVSGEATGATWAYDVSSGTWTRAADCPSPRLGHAAYYQNGKLVIYGGKHGENILNDMWSMDVESNEWTKIIPNGISPEGVKFPAYGNNGEVFWVAGGTIKKDDIYVSSDATWQYDIANNKWVKKANGPTFSFGAGVTLPDSKRNADYVAFVFGGKEEGDVFSNKTWIYTSADDLTDINDETSNTVNIKVYASHTPKRIKVESEVLIQQIEVFDSKGRRIQVQYPNDFNSEISFMGKPTQLYIILIKSNNWLIKRKVIL